MGMPLTHRRFTVDEYHRMAEVGILGREATLTPQLLPDIVIRVADLLP